MRLTRTCLSSFLIETPGGLRLLDVIGRFFAPEIGILPVGGSRLTMDPEQAAFAATELLGLRHVIPCHDFPLVDEAPDPEAMKRFLEFAPGMRDALGRKGREFEDLMAARHQDVAVTILGFG